MLVLCSVTEQPQMVWGQWPVSISVACGQNLHQVDYYRVPEILFWIMLTRWCFFFPVKILPLEITAPGVQIFISLLIVMMHCSLFERCSSFKLASGICERKCNILLLAITSTLILNKINVMDLSRCRHPPQAFFRITHLLTILWERKFRALHFNKLFCIKL